MMNVSASYEDKNNVTKDSLYEELDCIFDHFPKYLHEKFCWEIFMQMSGQNLFSDWHLGMRVYMKLLEPQTGLHLGNWYDNVTHQ